MTISSRSGRSGASSPAGTTSRWRRYKTEGAKVLLLTMGCLSEVAEVAVDEMRDAGLAVGLVKAAALAAFPLYGPQGRRGRRQAAHRLRPGPVPGRRGPAGAGGSAQRLLCHACPAPDPGLTSSAWEAGMCPRRPLKTSWPRPKMEAQQGPTQEYHIFGVRG